MISRLGVGAFGVLSMMALACSQVNIEPWQETGGSGGSGPVVGSGGTGGEALDCSPLAGQFEQGCIERNNTTTGVATTTGEMQYLHFISVSKPIDYEGMLCAYGTLSFGGVSIDGGADGACFRFTTNSLFESPEFSLIPNVGSVLANRNRRALVVESTGEVASPPSFLGELSLLDEDGSITWSRSKYEGTALDNFASFEDSLVLDDGDVAVTLILGSTVAGTVDFGDGFAFMDDGRGATAYLARFDGVTGATVAAYMLPTDPSAFHARPIQAADGSLTALVAAKEDERVANRWYALEGGAAVELARFYDVANASAALVDNRGELWVSGGAEGIRRIGRDGSCRNVAEFNAGVPFYAHDLALLPSGNIAALVDVFEGEPVVDGCSLTDPGPNGEAFAAEITPDGDWIRVARLTSSVPDGSRLTAVSQDDIVVYSLWPTEQRIERFDWSEGAF